MPPTPSWLLLHMSSSIIPIHRMHHRSAASPTTPTTSSSSPSWLFFHLSSSWLTKLESLIASLMFSPPTSIVSATREGGEATNTIDFMFDFSSGAQTDPTMLNTLHFSRRRESWGGGRGGAREDAINM
ncbi:unnamed protein product [Lactuca saligna]|uniref:Uncharacterized protein n=1 Tax=Lactuca saligna TaxID=75948 RepID=A0AA35Z3L4_LACSI|nr:unnamed protein product [Lactuca saligna]